MSKISRRSFVEHAVVGAAALGAAATRADAQLVYKSSDWKLAEFNRLLKDTSRVKQVFEEIQIGDGRFLNNMKNSLNGLRFGFDVPVDQIKMIGALHGPANMLNFDDTVWQKYRIGEWLKITDPKTGQPAVRNIYYPSKTAPSAQRVRRSERRELFVPGCEHSDSSGSRRPVPVLPYGDGRAGAGFSSSCKALRSNPRKS